MHRWEGKKVGSISRGLNKKFGGLLPFIFFYSVHDIFYVVLFFPSSVCLSVPLLLSRFLPISSSCSRMYLAHFIMWNPVLRPRYGLPLGAWAAIELISAITRICTQQNRGDLRSSFQPHLNLNSQVPTATIRTTSKRHLIKKQHRWPMALTQAIPLPLWLWIRQSTIFLLARQ